MPSWYGIAAFAGAWAAATLFLPLTCLTVCRSDDWACPLMSWLASASMLLNVFLLGTLDKDSYVRFAIWAGIATVVYVVYGVRLVATGREAQDFPPGGY
ncbi:amino acid transporter protein [Klebsormidium nitens]|uniref:Amino acid transporter protein n=1 Tax=Klebsormidium nitens TaxID=105231 RepID=A0A1Y1IH32_KLENI|nr:amino acid transporter protein [Klebsormidium nitens]|eukprot:GAQ88036.1 amino acid transporter protein [Klebsormidium nitens]